MSSRNKQNPIFYIFNLLTSHFFSNNKSNHLHAENAKTLLILWSFTTAFMIFYATYCYHLFGPKHVVFYGGLLATTIHTLTPLFFYRYKSFLLSGLMLSFSALFFQLLFCLYTGGINSPGMIWLAVHPIILGFFGNPIWIICSLALNSLIVLCFFYLDHLKILPMVFDDEIFERTITITALIGMDIIVAVYGILTIKVNKRRTKELLDSQELTNNILRVISHDISNPLFVILHSSKAIDENNFEEINLKNLERIRRAANDISYITQSIRTWMAHKDDKYVFTPVKIPVTSVIDHILFLYDNRLKEKNININFKVLNSDHAFFCDQTAILHQVFSNLISNAIKFSHINSFIDISFVEEENFLKTIIQDYGIGIDTSIVDKIFSPYVKTSHLGTSNERGTGYGLPIVAMTVKKLNGKIKIENAKEIKNGANGTIVTLHLPKAH